MHKIHWTSIYSTGISEFDAQHQWMMELSNRILSVLAAEGTPDRLANSLMSLIEFTKQHFHDEESLLRASGYPHLPAHKAAHNTHLRRLGKEISRINSGDNISVDSICDFLKSWLIDHILQEDKKAAQHILKKAPRVLAGIRLTEPHENDSIAEKAV